MTKPAHSTDKPQQAPLTQQALFQELFDILNKDGLVQQYGLQTINDLFFNPNPANPITEYNNDIRLEASLLGKTESADSFIAHNLIMPNAAQEKAILQNAFAGLNATSMRLQTADGVNLQGWYIPPQAGKATILFSTGLNGDILGAQPLLARLASDGYGVFTYQYRGFGAADGGSTGTPTEEGMYHDLQKISGMLVKGTNGFQKTDYSQQILMGYSLGSDISAHDAAKDGHDYRSVALIDPPRSFVDDVKIEAAATDPQARQILEPYQDSLLKMEDKIKGMFDIHQDISKLDAPLFFAEGSQDTLTPPDIAQTLFDKASSHQPKTYLTVDGANHYDVLGSAAYVKSIADGLETFIQQTNPNPNPNQIAQDIAAYYQAKPEQSGDLGNNLSSAIQAEVALALAHQHA